MPNRPRAGDGWGNGLFDYRIHVIDYALVGDDELAGLAVDDLEWSLVFAGGVEDAVVVALYYPRGLVCEVVEAEDFGGDGVWGFFYGY